MTIAPPMGLIVELTHRCPLQCGYCSNPVALDRQVDELGTDELRRVLDEAAALGILQVHFSGGEPMARLDLEQLVAHANAVGLYTNIITSGVLLDRNRMDGLLAAGIDHIQLSFQDSRSEFADKFGHYRGAHEKKKDAAALIRNAGLPLTANFVVHRANIERIDEMIVLAEALHADRIEIAHVQYYGWALLNRGALLPSPGQLETATLAVDLARLRLGDRIAIDYVVPDYYAARPKACMGGWGQRFITLSPAGKALPCHAAATIPDMQFETVRDQSLAAIWQRSEAFVRYRGTDWMPEGCKTCDRREADWGGCRCQALAMTGRANAMDPVCERSPDRETIHLALREAGQDGSITPRRLRPVMGLRFPAVP